MNPGINRYLPAYGKDHSMSTRPANEKTCDLQYIPDLQVFLSQFGEATLWNARLCESNLHDSIKDLVHSGGSLCPTRLINQVLHRAFAALVLISYNSYNDAEEQIRLT